MCKSDVIKELYKGIYGEDTKVSFMEELVFTKGTRPRVFTSYQQLKHTDFDLILPLRRSRIKTVIWHKTPWPSMN